jgi:DNA-binding transcriptional LysR family regulator
MLDLNDVFYFVQVVDRGGFTSAGQILRLPKSTLSHRIRELEAALGVRLLNRTSRQLSMTEVGAEFYQYAQEMLRTAQVAEETIKQRLSEPSGTIRLTTAAEVAQFALRDIIPSFLKTNPKVQIVEVATDRMVDIIGEGFDIALRGHTASLQNSTLIQRSIAKVPWYIFASRDYLERSKMPTDPEQISRHSTLTLLRNGPSIWRLRGPNAKEVVVPIEPRFVSNNMVTLKEAACSGIGLVALPGYICKEELRTGALEQVLPGWIAQDAQISALVPYRVGILPAVRSLLDFLAVEVPKATAFEPAGS